MSKKVYKKSDKPKKPQKPNTSIEEKPKEEEVIVVKEEKKEEIVSQPIPLTAIDADAFSKYKSITGVNRDFLMKKYANKNYVLKIWEEILIKEKLN